jgi:hypothetical protein
MAPIARSTRRHWSSGPRTKITLPAWANGSAPAIRSGIHAAGERADPCRGPRDPLRERCAFGDRRAEREGGVLHDSTRDAHVGPAGEGLRGDVGVNTLLRGPIRITTAANDG